MPWYLVEASHGPGHQSHTSKFRWSEFVLVEDETRELWNDIFGRHEYDWPIGSCFKLEGLAENLKGRMQVRQQEKIDQATKMLKILADTPVIAHEIIDTQKKLCSCGRRCYTCSRCGTVLCYTFPPDASWCPDCQSCQGGKHEWTKEPPIVCTKCGVEHPFEKDWKRHRERDGKAKDG